MTPPARKGTTLKEHRRADAGAVVNGVFLDIEDDAGLGHISTIQLNALVVNIQMVYNIYICKCYQGKNMPKTKQPPPRESDRIESELRRLILTLELEPGLAISEASLMKQYSWGRTPLREAFQRLAEQSLLQIIPRHGVLVTPLSVFDFVEVMDAMSMVIGPSAALACKRLSDDQLDQLDQLVAQGETAVESGDHIQVAELDYEFHRVLADATGNRYLRDYLLHIHRVATRFNFAAWKRGRDAGSSLEEHRQLAELFRQRDAVQVKAAMLEHIQNARQRVLGTINQSEPFQDL